MPGQQLLYASVVLRTMSPAALAPASGRRGTPADGSYVILRMLHDCAIRCRAYCSQTNSMFQHVPASSSMFQHVPACCSMFQHVSCCHQLATRGDDDDAWYYGILILIISHSTGCG
jgi:hypothetical protein